MKHFKINEFNCKCGCGRNKMSDEFLRKLDQARELAGTPFVITSGYRCQAHNKEVGGVPESSHTKGLAVDIKATNNRARYMILYALLSVGFNRIGIYASFIHVDMDTTKAERVIWRG